LLAMVDSSVGGKTGVDLPQGKNLAGAFHQPALVLCDPQTTSTLPSEVFADGVAEAIKTAVIGDATLFSVTERGDWNDRLDEVIARCIQIKAAIVAEDEFERGDRKKLNLGHTLGHAIEKCTGYRVSHGHAVSMGLAAVARAGCANGVTPQHICERIIRALDKNGLPTSLPLPMKELIPAIANDKKRAGTMLTLVIPVGIGDCRLMEMPLEEAMRFLQRHDGLEA